MERIEKMPFKIGNIAVTDKGSVYIIAEIGVNHNGSVNMAKQLINAAKKAGADAVKFQTYQTDQLVTPKSKLAIYQKSTNYTSQFDMLKKYQLNRQEFEEVKKFCDDLGITFISTPFDKKSAELLEEMNVVAYKIGSGDLTHYSLLQQLATYNKPIILSTGMATLQDIQDAVQIFPKHTQLALLHCTSAYPAPYNEVHLRVIETFKEHFDCIVGYSDHTLGIEIPYAATSLGYKIIEKHLTLDNTMEGPDHKSSLNTEDFKIMVKGIRQIEAALGSTVKHVTPSELDTKKTVRRGIYLGKEVTKGHRLSEEDLSYLRPATHIEAKQFKNIIGKKIKCDKPIGSPLLWEDLET
ncbi:N-acetylneuraminate synthase [Salipaludibacillus neizhouensis]|nr:N-acetylneuraminate synthase [Salipaludibacillus neizhouensis]